MYKGCDTKKSRLRVGSSADLEDFKESEKEILANSTIEDDFKNFLDAKEEALDKAFLENYEYYFLTLSIDSV